MFGCRSLTKIALACTASTVFLSYPALAQDDFYKGKTITILVGYSPGGGYDVYARTVARYFGKHTPGNPNIIVQNMPGAASLKSARYLDAGAPQDGTLFATFDPGLITDSLTVPDKVPERFTNYNWIGAIVKDLRVCYTMTSNKVKTWDQVMTADGFTLGSTGRGSSAYKNSIIIKNMFNAPVKVIMGYPGSNEQRLAMERNEIDAICGNWTAIPESWLAEKKANPFVKFSQAMAPGMSKDVPFIGDLAKTEEDKKLLRVLFASGDAGRPFAASGKVPMERIKTLRAAFDGTMKDAEFLADAKKQSLLVDPTPGEEVAKIVAAIYEASPELAAKAGKLVE